MGGWMHKKAYFINCEISKESILYADLNIFIISGVTYPNTGLPSLTGRVITVSPACKEQPKLDLKQPEPKPKISFWFRFRFSRKPKFDILFRPRPCRNQLFSRNFGRNRNIGYIFGQKWLFCQIFRLIWFLLTPIAFGKGLSLLKHPQTHNFFVDKLWE